MRLGLPFALLTLTMACGARTGLRVPSPDVTELDDVPDALDVVDADDAVDAPDAPDVCAAQTQPVVRFSAEVLFVIDRSGSMADRTPSGVTRWEAMTSALAQVLPSVDRELWTGLVLYPNAGSLSATACASPTQLSLSPRALNAGNILSTLRDASLGGGTPTWDALRVAGNFYSANPPVGPLRGRYVVLTTDGGPNCNPALDARSCVCTNGRGCLGARGNLSCLDETRTVSLLRELAARDVPTFVIGTGSDVAVMNNLAIAGGRARPLALGGTRYYRAEDANDFLTNFRAITTSLVRCRFVTNPVPEGARVVVRVGGRVWAEDPSRVDGFAWERREAGEFTLNGPACEEAARGGGAVRLEFPCGS
ncbi:MAG: vWA domain-containing protein [Polyangiales bacterium]